MPRKTIAKTAKKSKQIAATIRTDVYNLRGQVVGKTSLPGAIFSVKASPQLVAQAVRVYQANQRMGTASTKTRSEVAGSTRKIYRQKGTGRARHGAITAPIFIGGGVAHGPHPHDFGLSFPQKMRKNALFSVLTDKFQSGELKVVRGFGKIELKTKKMNDALTKLKLTDKRGDMTKILLVTPQNHRNIILAGRNIENLTIGDVKLLNTYQIISNKNIILMEEAVPVLTGHFLSQKKVKNLPRIPAVKLTQKLRTSPKKVTSKKIIKKITKVKKSVKRKK